MKRSIVYLSLLALAVACQREEFDYPPAPDPLPQATRLHLEAGKPDPEGEATKTYWTGSTIEWSAGDAIQLGFTANGSWGPAIYPSEELDAAAATAHFEVDAVQSGSAPYRFYTVYPSAAASSYSAGSHTVALTLPAAQTPVRNGGNLSFDPAADLLYGVSRDSYDSWPDVGAIPINWSRLVALGNVTLKNLPGSFASETVRKVTLTFQDDAEVAGDFTLDLSDGSMSPADAGNVITLDGTNLAVADSKLELWFAMVPATVTSLGIIVETDKAYYSRAVSALSLDFKCNARNTLGVNMASAVRTEKAFYLVTMAPEDWSGEYLIGYGSNFFAGKGDGNYAAYTTLTIDDDHVSYSDGNAYKVIIAKVDGSYYSLQYGSKYVGYKSGGNYLQFGDAVSGNDFKWTIAIDEGTTTLRNVGESSYYLQWNNNSLSYRFSAYTGTQKNVSLYRLGAPSAGEPSFSLVQERLEVPFTAGSYDIDLVYSLVGGAESDIRLSYDGEIFSSVSVGSGSLHFTIAANAGTSAREETITLTYAGKGLGFTVSQEGGRYDKVTAGLTDWSGEYLLGYLTDATTAQILTGKATGDYGDKDEISVSAGAIAYSDGSTYNLTIAKVTGENYYTLKLGDKYLYYTGSNNKLFFGDTASGDSYHWTIEYSAGVETITNVAATSRKLQYNTSDPRFACYTTTQGAITLFRRSDCPTPAAGGGGGASAPAWLELPSWDTANMTGTTTSTLTDLYNVTHYATMGGAQARNYSILYDPEMYASYWVAYPMTSNHFGSGRDESWGYDPLIPVAKQTKVSGGAYGVSVDSENYGNQYYARGHQLANADRNGVDGMMAQTYYSTNLTPQLQNGFNGGIWSDLEGAVRNVAKAANCDTVYVVTGAAFRKKTDGTESIKTIVSKRDSKTLPIPNYYYKVLLKVRRNGSGEVTNASAIGFWLDHREYIGESYTSYKTSVDQIEAWTGFDFFTNLPVALQTSAEANTNWSTFQSFSTY